MILLWTVPPQSTGKQPWQPLPVCRCSLSTMLAAKRASCTHLVAMIVLFAYSGRTCIQVKTALEYTPCSSHHPRKKRDVILATKPNCNGAVFALLTSLYGFSSGAYRAPTMTVAPMPSWANPASVAFWMMARRSCTCNA